MGPTMQGHRVDPIVAGDGLPRGSSGPLTELEHFLFSSAGVRIADRKFSLGRVPTWNTPRLDAER